MILYSGAASESQRDYWKRAHRVDGRLLSTETAGCLSKLLNKASSTTPPSNSTGPRSLSSGKHSFHLKCHVPNCTLHQIVLNGIQTNFNVVPTFSLNAPLSPFSLLIAKQAISPSPCSTSGLHSRWGVEKGENIGKRKGGTQRAQNKDWDNVLGEVFGGSYASFLGCQTDHTWDGSLMIPPGHVPVVLQISRYNRNISKQWGFRRNERCEPDRVTAELEA